MPPAARITDNHTCPKVEPGPIPHVGGPIITGETTVLIGFQPAARVTDKLTCVPAIDAISRGEPTVKIGHQDAARIGDPTVHGGKIVQGCPTVLIGSQSYCLKSAAKSASPFVSPAE
ncbi:MAG: PAAR domain-containing protein [Polyangiaceae bacterium]